MSHHQVLIDTPTLQARIEALGSELVAQFKDIDEPLLVIGVLRGSVLFMADLVRTMDRPLETEYIRASSYGDARVSSGPRTDTGVPIARCTNVFRF